MRYQNKTRDRATHSAGFDQNHGRPGFIYILSNSAFIADFYKIGCTTHSGAKRAAQLNKDAKTGTPALFNCVFEMRTVDCGLAEQRVFSELSRNRKGKRGQEYFLVNIEQAKDLIRRVCAEVDQEQRDDLTANLNDEDCRSSAFAADPLCFKPISKPMSASAPEQVPMVPPVPLAQSSQGETSRHVEQASPQINTSLEIGKIALFLALIVAVCLGFGAKHLKTATTPSYGAADSNQPKHIETTNSLQSATQENKYPVSTRSNPATLGPDSLLKILAPEVEDFNQVTGVGRIVYSTLPKGERFDGHREYIGRPYEIRLIRTVEIEGSSKIILFFSSSPLGVEEDEFECHACSPILSAILVESDGTSGLSVVLPLQLLGPHGSWGKIRLDDENLSPVHEVGPGKNGFSIKDGGMAQGYVEIRKTAYSIEDDGFKRLGDFHVHSDSFGAYQCEDGKQEDCPHKDSYVSLNKSSARLGYFDVTIMEKNVEVQDNAINKWSRQYTLCFDGIAFQEHICDSGNSDYNILSSRDDRKVPRP